MKSKYKENILALKDSGKTQKEIAAIVGCSPSVVSYHFSPSKCKNRIIDRKKEIREWFTEYTKYNYCIICNENERVCLDYHHIVPNDKKETVSHLVCKGYSREAIIEEIGKCACLCSNCHRKVHANILTIPI